MDMPMPKKLNGLLASFIAKTNATTIMIATAMVMTIMMTMIAVTMTTTLNMMIVQRAQEVDKAVITDLIPPSTLLTPVSSAPTMWILASYWMAHALSIRMASTPCGSVRA